MTIPHVSYTSIYTIYRGCQSTTKVGHQSTLILLLHRVFYLTDLSSQIVYTIYAYSYIYGNLRYIYKYNIINNIN